MKKFICCLLVLTMGLSCTKDDPMVLCGCSPVVVPTFRLIIKDDQNKDLLDPSRQGSFDKQNIKVTYRVNGVVKDIPYNIREPFSYGESLRDKFPFYQLISQQLGVLQTGNRPIEFFVDLGDGQRHTISYDYNQAKASLENVQIDGIAAEYEASLPEVYGRIYYLLK